MSIPGGPGRTLNWTGRYPRLAAVDGATYEMEELVDALREIDESPDPETIRELFAAVRTEDIAVALSRVDTEIGVAVLSALDEETAAEVLVELPTESARALARDLSDTTLAIYLDVLPMDDALDLREDIGDERFDGLLQVIPDEDAQEIKRLLTYPEDSVGRLMTERFFWVGRDQPMWQVLSDLRAASDEKYESVNDLYVLTAERHLVGVFSLRKALRAGPEILASELMNSDVISCEAHESAEEAARRMSRYGLYALPVLDRRGRMVGLFTGDDAQDVLEEAETEQVLSLGAVSGSAESYVSLSVWQLAKRRLPWLAGLFVAEFLTGSVLRHYGQESGLGAASLMYFVPLLIGAGGNVGSQVTTTVTRALALDEVGWRDWWLVMRRELAVALVIGAVLGTIGFLRALMWKNPLDLSLTVAVALPMIVVWAGTVGSLLPIAAKRVGVDPAVMSAPFIATLVDATGLIIYFESARMVMGSIRA